MPATLEYLRPKTVAEAAALLRRPGLRTVPLAGGTWLAPRLRRDVDVPDPLSEPVDAVVDLTGLDLSYVELEGEPGNGWLRLGATATLAELADSPACQQVAGGVLATAARREAPTNQRNMATVAGVVWGAESRSQLLLALLALAAQAVIFDGESRAVPLDALLAEGRGELAGALATELRLPWPSQTARAGMARVARTPTDQPIVAAVAVADGGSRRLALGGVAALPLLLRLSAQDDLDAALETALQGVDVVSDWLGSGEYRRAMAFVLSRRALADAAS